MKITEQIQERRKKNLHHLNRIQGQIETLKVYIEDEECCSKIAQLTTSIAKSFDTLRVRTLESFLHNELLAWCDVSPKKLEKLDELLKLHKK